MQGKPQSSGHGMPDICLSSSGAMIQRLCTNQMIMRACYKTKVVSFGCRIPYFSQSERNLERPSFLAFRNDIASNP